MQQEPLVSETPDPRTLTLPDDLRGAYAMPDLVVGLLQRDTGALHPFPADRSELTLGTRPGSDITLDNPFVSRNHCRLERDGALVWVRDPGSHNGTLVDGARIENGVLPAGGQLVLSGTGGVRFVAMTRLMVAALPMARMILGYAHDGTADDALSAAVRPDNVAILGEPGTMHARLIDVLHRVSPRRGMTQTLLEALPSDLDAQRRLIEDAHGATLAFLVNAGTRPIDQLARALLFEADHHVRVMIAAPSTEIAARVVGAAAFSRMHVISIQPVRGRGGETERLLDACLEQVGSGLRVADLSPSNTAALLGHTWPDNTEEMWQVARWLHAISLTGSIRKAATTLGIPRTTLQGWLANLGVELPL
jgi:hypothetical protein